MSYPFAASLFGNRDGLTRMTAHAVETGRVELSGSLTGLRLSPDASRFIVEQFGYDSRERSQAIRSGRHVIGTLSGRRREIDAMRVEFVDNEKLLVLREVDGKLDLRLEHADSAAAVWATQLTALFDPKLIVSPRDGTWMVAGGDWESDSVLVLRGTIVSPEWRAHRFAPLESLGGSYVDYMVFEGGQKLLVPMFTTTPRQAALPLMLVMSTVFSPVLMDLWELTPSGSRKVGELGGYPQCAQPDDGRAVCLVQEGNRARVLALDASGKMQSITMLPGIPDGKAAPGLHMIVVDRPDRLTDVDVAARLVTHVRLPSSSGVVIDVKRAAERLGVLLNESGVTRLLFFRIEKPAA